MQPWLKRMFACLLVLAFALLGAVWLVAVYVKAPAWRASTVMVSDLRQFAAGRQVLEDALRLANDLAAIEGRTRRERVSALRERADDRRTAVAAMAEAFEQRESLAPFPEMSGLLRQAAELLDTAVEGSPSQPIAEEAAAEHALLETEAEKVGVLEGVRALISQRARQIRAEADELVRQAEQAVLGSEHYDAEFVGLSARVWLTGLSTLACALLAACALAALCALRAKPEQLVMYEIRRLNRTSFQKAIQQCYERMDELLDLANSLAADQ